MIDYEKFESTNPVLLQLKLIYLINYLKFLFIFFTNLK